MPAFIKKLGEPDDITRELFARRVALLYHNARSAILMATGVALVFVVVMWPVIPHGWLVAWIAAMVLINLGRYGLVRAFYRAAPANTEIQPWLSRFTIAAAISGVAWGCIGVFFIPENNGIYQAFTILVLCGISGAASTTYASVLAVYRAYVFPIVIPVIIHMFYIGDSVHIGLGVTIALYLLLTSQHSVLIMHNTLVESLSFGLKNVALVKKLEAAIVQYQQAQAELAEMSELNKTVIQHTDSGIMAYKPGGECVLMNEAAAKMMSTSLEKGLHTNFQQIAIWKKSGLLEAAQSVLHTGVPQVTEASMRTIYGQDIWLIAHLWRISKGNEPVLLVVAHDIANHKNTEHTLQRAKEAAEKAARIKDQFLADISHAVHEPMNEIIRLSDVGLKGNDGRISLEKIRSVANRFSGVVANILDFSRVAAGGDGAEQHPFKLDLLLDEVWAPAEMYARSKSLQLIRKVGDGVPNNLLGDNFRLRQALTILMGNAIKYTERGHVMLSIEKRSQLGQRIFLECSVSDTGVGMTLEQQEQLFQLSAEPSQISSGSPRLGVSVWKALVEQMGGEVSVTSNMGQGSTFSFMLALLDGG